MLKVFLFLWNCFNHYTIGSEILECCAAPKMQYMKLFQARYSKECNIRTKCLAKNGIIIEWNRISIGREALRHDLTAQVSKKGCWWNRVVPQERSAAVQVLAQCCLSKRPGTVWSNNQGCRLTISPKAKPESSVPVCAIALHVRRWQYWHCPGLRRAVTGAWFLLHWPWFRR